LSAHYLGLHVGFQQQSPKLPFCSPYYCISKDANASLSNMTSGGSASVDTRNTSNMAIKTWVVQHLSLSASYLYVHTYTTQCAIYAKYNTNHSQIKTKTKIINFSFR